MPKDSCRHHTVMRHKMSPPCVLRGSPSLGLAEDSKLCLHSGHIYI